MSRPLCKYCLRPLISCYCDLCLNIDNQVEVAILQHPSEENHPKGTAGLLHKSLNDSQLITTEQLDLGNILNTGKQTVLLFPTGEDAQTIKAADLTPSKTQLIVIDGTWRKARKLIHTHSWLKQLPRLALTETTPLSRYDIRKAEKPEQLSTLESVCYALTAIENNDEKYRPLLDNFDEYIQRFKRFIKD